jgi:cell division protease FtsH
MLYGGRVAEEMIFGPAKVTTGAGNDIERATQMARRMVTRFGMSDLVGLMAVGESDHEVFLGREISQRRDVSEHTAQLVDQEVKRLLDQSHQRARDILEKQQELLESIAQALLERETLNREEVDLLGKGKDLPPMRRPEDAAAEEPPASSGAEGSPDAAPTGDDVAEEVEDAEESEASVSTPVARRTREEPDPNAV